LPHSGLPTRPSRRSSRRPPTPSIRTASWSARARADQNQAAIIDVAPPGNESIVVDAEIVFVDPDGIPVTGFDTGDIVATSRNVERRTAELSDALTS
jgi:hypothetical protein